MPKKSIFGRKQKKSSLSCGSPLNCAYSNWFGYKFQLRLTILIFWAKFAQNGCFWSKTENSHLWVCPWSFLTILNAFARGPTEHNIICNKTRQRRVKRLLMTVKARRRVKHVQYAKRVRRVFIIGKARINDG